MKPYFIKTFGCQMNEHDSEVVAGMLESLGFIPTDRVADAGIIILNTCCIRGTAENKVFSFLGRLRKQKKANPDLIIGVCGCMTQQDHMAARLHHLFPYVDLIFGTHNLHRLPELIKRVEVERVNVQEVLPALPKELVEGLPVKRKGKIRAWLNIMYGCDNFCTYCIVPYVRGRERSRRPEDIIEEAAKIGREGYKEITLLGQNVNSYGKDLDGILDFAGLLQMLENVGGIDRIRYMTSHPRDFTDKLIEVISQSGKVCEHFHLPVQAGSNRVLGNMKRGYTREEYLKLIEKIVSSIPRATITTDIMVGFPGEEEVDFEETLELVRQVRFDSSYTFVYNARSGTPAAAMPGQIPEPVKKERIQALIRLQNQISLEKNVEEAGQIYEVLVEGESNSRSGLLLGRNRGNKIVTFEGSKNLITKNILVTITEGHLAHLSGIINNNKR